MIVAWIFLTTVCCAFSQPVTRPNSDVRVISKRNLKQDPVNSFDEDAVLEEPLDFGTKFEGFTWRDIFSPRRLWSLHCEPNCGMPPEDYPDASVEGKDDNDDNDDNEEGDVTLESIPAAEDIVLHLNADKDLMRFIQWTTSQLGPLHSNNASGNYNGPGLSTWIRLNLSGRREPPLYVEEPKYIVIRRDVDDLTPQFTFSNEMPFIPPRGRKFNLEVLKKYNDHFVPNRGKKKTQQDILKDILRYDDIFFPHRGKRDKTLKDILKYDDVFFPHRGKKFDDSTGDLKPAVASGRRFYTPPFEDCFTRCNDIPSAPVLMATADQADKINELVPATTLHLTQVSSSTRDAATDGQREAAACGGGAAAVAECQKQNDVKINGFDQSVKAQMHQQQQQPLPLTGAAVVSPLQLQHRQRRLSSARASASVETSESSFLPFIWSDQVHRVIQQPPHPIRPGQWRDYRF